MIAFLGIRLTLVANLRRLRKILRALGCLEFTSDVEINEAGSIEAHEDLASTLLCDIRCFRKAIKRAN